MKKNYRAQNVNEAKVEKYWSNIQKNLKQNKWDFHVQIQHSKSWQANTPTVTTIKRIDTTRMRVLNTSERTQIGKKPKIPESFGKLF